MTVTDFSHCGFLEEQYLIALALPVVALLLCFFRAREKLRRCMLFGFPCRTPWRNIPWGLVAILALIALSLPRPFWGGQELSVPAKRHDLFLVVDVSNSMLARDGAPTRLDLAKRKVQDLVTAVSQALPGDRLALSVFAGTTHVLVPLTTDHDVARFGARSIDPTLVPVGGTALGEALLVTADVARNAELPTAIAVVFSDGEDRSFQAARVLQELRDARIRVYTLGFGSIEGARIELADGSSVIDASGRPVVSKLDADTLQQLANETGGRYFPASLGDADIAELTSLLVAERRASTASETIRAERELGPLFLKAALGVLLACFILGARERVFPSLALIVALLSANPAAAQQGTAEQGKLQEGSLHDAWREYESGNYDAALNLFRQFAARSPADSEVLLALGAAQYRSGDATAARETFQALSAQATNARHKYAAEYNRGTIELGLNNYEEAIAAFDTALAVKPGDAAALHNRRVAEFLREQRQTPRASAAQSSSSSQSSSQSSSESSSASSSAAPSSDRGENSSPHGSSLSAGTGSDAADSASSPAPPPNGSSGDSESQDPTSHSSRSGASSSAAGSAQGSSTQLNDTHGSKESPAERSSHGSSRQGNERDSNSPTDRNLSEKEAQEWLQSLPDSVTIPRPRLKRRGGQDRYTW